MDHSTNGDVGDGQGVAGQDVRLGAGHDLVAGLQAQGRQDIALLAVLILDQSDVGAAVGIVLQAQHGGGADLVPLGIRRQLDIGLFPGLGHAGTAGTHALLLAGHRQGVDRGNLHTEDLLHRLLDLDLAGVLGHLEDVLLVGGTGHGALGDDGADDNIVSGSHYAYTSSIFARASLSTTRYLAFRMS